MNLPTIHQTKEWANFRKSAKGEQFWEIIIEDDTARQCYGIIQKMPLPLGKSWLYCNRGPVFYKLSEAIFKEFLERVNEIAKQENAIFLRVEPPFDKETSEGKEYSMISEKLGFRNAHVSHQPECTLIIDLDQSLDEILSAMKQKGRYNIRLAEKKGVKVRESVDFDAFYSILEETTKRDQFTSHNKEFYRKMIELLGAKDMAKLYLAEYQGKIIAGIIVTYFEDTTTYYYGASSNKHRNVMAPYLLQWHAIKEAKSRGMKVYDFMGISPPDAKNHPWQGVTEFKLKFGGKTIEYVKAKELVFKPFWYWIIKMIKKLRGK